MVLESCGQQVREFLLGVDFSDKQFRAEFGSEARVSSGCYWFRSSIALDTLKETLKYMSDRGMFL